MKKTILLSLVTVALMSTTGYAQEKVKTEKVEKKEIRKEVKVEEENGEKTLTIVTEENGKKTEEVYKGEKAEEKLAELMEAHGGMEEEKKETIEVKVEEIDGKKKVTIEKMKDGKKTVEVYEGDDAEKKLKEIGGVEMEVKEERKMITKEKKVIKKESM